MQPNHQDPEMTLADYELGSRPLFRFGRWFSLAVSIDAPSEYAVRQFAFYYARYVWWWPLNYNPLLLVIPAWSAFRLD